MAARLAYVDFIPPNENEAFNTGLHAPKVIEGIRLISDWVKSF